MTNADLNKKYYDICVSMFVRFLCMLARREAMCLLLQQV